MGLPRLKAHDQVDGHQMNILMDALEVLIGNSLPDQGVNTTTIGSLSLVTSVTGAGGLIAAPSTGNVELVDFSTPIQYYVRRHQVTPQSFTVTNIDFSTFYASFPVVYADPKNQAVGDYGFDFGIGGIRDGDTFLVHSRLTFQAPGARSQFYSNVEWNGGGVFTQGAGNMGAVINYSDFDETGVEWVEILAVASYFSANSNWSIMGPLGFIADAGSATLPFTFSTTGNPTENFLEVFYLGFIDPSI